MGMAFNDFVMVATDQTNARSIMVMKEDEDKVVPMSDRFVKLCILIFYKSRV